MPHSLEDTETAFSINLHGRSQVKGTLQSYLRITMVEARLFVPKEPITMWDDKQSCINTAHGDCNFNNKRMKHVDIQLHFIK
ncbi:hypothetical protein O181_014602 [Austropuccinia psidii MF-1]|uniref:Uncharacterized protein n=1 Tax=Austropuccinia psidii MF-1 TaxID=1389203 RepID=A0A9Q3C1Y6_9BASI|nr:hypothetical protein [Austropuccinia psidii MF-1]